MPALEGLGRVAIGLYYPDKIRIWRVSGLFLDPRRLIYEERSLVFE
jgi:hypothetical protein